MLKKFVLGLVLAASFSASAMASVVRTSEPGGYNGYMQWGDYQIGMVKLAQGTNMVSSLTSSVDIWDQGWGNQSDANQVYIGLYQNDAILWGQHVAGAHHGWSRQTFDIASNLTALTSLNEALRAIDWSSGGTVTMKMMANPIGWPGWELHVANAYFSVTSDTVQQSQVPEPASVALLSLGLAGLVASRRKSLKK